MFIIGTKHSVVQLTCMCIYNWCLSSRSNCSFVIIIVILFILFIAVASNYPFVALTLLVGRQEGHLMCKTWVLISVMLRPQGQNFGLGLGLDKLASISSIWPQPGLGLVNFASKMCSPMQNSIGCIIATFITKTWLNTLNVGQKFSFVLLALSPCVLIQKYLPWPASASKIWPRPRGSGLGLRVWPCPRHFGLV